MTPPAAPKPVNLNKVRKARKQAERRALADANAVKFGRSKAQRAAEALEAARQTRAFEQGKRMPKATLEDGDTGSPSGRAPHPKE